MSPISPLNKLLISSFLILIALLAACDLENIEPVTGPHAPLGLNVSSSNSTVYLHFWALNDEDYFAGYNVFLAQEEEAVAESPHPDNDPFEAHQRFTSARKFTLSVETDNEGSALQTGDTWYFAVTAYDSFYEENSRPSEIRSITVAD